MPSWPAWQGAVQFNPDVPGVKLLHESAELKVVLVGLRAGQQLPAHAGPAASFIFLDGDAVMISGDDELPVSAGAIVTVPTSVKRGIRAVSDTVFLGNLGDPSSETPPG